MLFSGPFPQFTGHRHLGKVFLLWGLDFPPKISRLLQVDKKGSDQGAQDRPLPADWPFH